MPNKIDSNQTGLRYAKETSLRVLPGTPDWKQLEPNSYSDFGGQYKQVARNPINADRQNKKGTIADLDVSGGFNQDFTMVNMLDILQGFFFAALREKATSQPINGTAIALTATTTTTYTAASGLGSFKPNHIVNGSGFAIAANNGIRVLSAASATTLTTTGLSVETPPAAAKVEAVGWRFPVGIAAIAMNGSLVRLTTSTDQTTMGLVPGEWIYLGSDTGSAKFATNVGWARVSTHTAAHIEFDKVSWASPGVESGAGLTIEIYFGSVLKNEAAALIVKQTYQLERTLNVGDTGSLVQAEYLEGAVANQLTLNVPQADKVTADLNFMAIAHVLRNSATGPKTGNRPTLGAADAINTSSDPVRIRLALVSTTNASVTPLVAYLQDLSITINNNVTVNKALGTLGGFDTSVGNFDVTGQVTAFFTDTSQLGTVSANSDVTLDVIMVERQRGIAIDFPLIALGDGRLKVEQNQPVDMPLESNMVQSAFGHTMLLSYFAYLPALAG